MQSQLTRTGAAVAAIGLCVTGWVLAGCGPAAQEAAPPDERKARVMEFWRLYHEASAARARRDPGAAAATYQAALRLDPDHEDSLYHLGQSLQETGQVEGALASFLHLVEVNDHSARGHLALGALLASVDESGPWDLDRAERHLRRAHEINGEETGPMVRLGEVRLVRGDAAEAEQWLNAAASTNPKSVEAAFLSGYLRWAAGDRAAALEWYERARKAARSEAPVKGVLGEGDRKAAGGQAAPGAAPTSPSAARSAPGAAQASPPTVPASRPAAGAEPVRVAAPPLEAPMGRTLFDELCDRLGHLEAPQAYAEAEQRIARLSRRPQRSL